MFSNSEMSYFFLICTFQEAIGTCIRIDPKMLQMPTTECEPLLDNRNSVAGRDKFMKPIEDKNQHGRSK